MSELLGASVNLRGLLQVVGQHLYSSPEVALRELVQNAHDSAVRRSIEDEAAPEAQIRVVARPDEQTLRFIDNGAGLTRDEVVQYLATIGSGKTGELRSTHSADALIGQFGLGFLSAYAVAHKVVVHTTSHAEPDLSHTFTSLDGERFTLSPGPPRAVGTEVVLHLKSEHAHLARVDVVRQLLARYCCLLPIPVLAPTPVNAEPPPWRRDLDGLTPFRIRRIRLDFAEAYEGRFRPIACIPVEPSESVPIRGLLWIQDGASYASSDNRNISLFVRGMLISDDLRDLVPRWAGFVGGVLECDHLLPTASREDVQRDASFSATVAHLREVLIQGLATLADREHEAWAMCRTRHNEALLGASLADPRLFEVMRDSLTVPTSHGALTLPEVRQRSDGRLLLSPTSSSAVPLWFRTLDAPLIASHRYGVSPFVARWAQVEQVRTIQLGSGDEGALLEAVELPPDEGARLERCFVREQTAVLPARFKPTTLGAVLLEDQEVRLKRTLEADDASRRIAHGLLGLARDVTRRIDGAHLYRLYVNLDNPLVARALHHDDAQLAAYVVSFAELGSHLDQDLTEALSAQQDALLNILARVPEDRS
ncbi:MAG: ATP-binding protein [Alphaproteobacteria bacterium]|nr:ATP-binding protein [Alphaproteobacteria bacterium]MCB9699993.1 ATP-binding protein [Alphaproteobacteria bacterium]